MGPNPSHKNTLPPFTCSPSTKEGQSPEPMETGKSCTKVVLRSSEPKLSKQLGRRSLPNGQRDQRQSFPNGSESAQAKKKETQRHLKAKKKLKMPPRKNMMKRRKRKRRRKKNKLLLQSISRLKSKPLTSYIPKTSHCFYTNEWLLCSTRYNLFCIEL